MTIRHRGHVSCLLWASMWLVPSLLAFVACTSDRPGHSGPQRDAGPLDAADVPPDSEAPDESRAPKGTELWWSDCCPDGCCGGTHLLCSGGKVWTNEGVDDCSRTPAYTCSLGCRTDGMVMIRSYADPATLCEENRPPAAGDACAEEAECDPLMTTLCGSENHYLGCDLGTETCERTDPPNFDRWLDPCGVEWGDIEPGAFGFVETEACPGAVCLVHADCSSGCVRQGCTVPCDSDENCPVGSGCKEGLFNRTPGGGQDLAVCKPGPYNVIGCELECP